MRKKVKLTIDNIEVKVETGTTILEAARSIGIDIPTLCYLNEINETGACRMCIVEIEGIKGYSTSCTTKVAEGMKVKTRTKDIIKTRKNTLQLILSNHNKSCLTCIRNTNCELQDLAKKMGIKDVLFEGEKTPYIVDDSSLCISRDNSKCILCGRCVNICSNVQTVSAITKISRGFQTQIGVANNYNLAESTCVGCGQCIVNCPTGALTEKDYISDVIDALNKEDLHLVVQTAPAIRATIGEEFGMPIGTLTTGKLVAALKRLGFHKVFDTDFAADLTIMEESAEFIDRLNKNEGLPLITSCSSGWITFVEKFFPDILNHVSTAKSPMAMMGTVIKTYYADKENLDPKKIYSVAIMPCSAKKAEIVRPELKVAGLQMVDVVLTTRELARLLKLYNIDLNEMEDEEFDMPMGEATGAGHIFGTTGGVMEAALRTVTEVMTGKTFGKLDFKELRGMKGIRESNVDINGRIIKIAVADGLSNVRKLVQQIADGKSKYDFIEVMTCPGGCIMGGGQPIKTSFEKSKYDIKKLRAKALYMADKQSQNRRSYENKSVRKLYKEYIGDINGQRAQELLHTNYHKQSVYTKKPK